MVGVPDVDGDANSNLPLSRLLLVTFFLFIFFLFGLKSIHLIYLSSCIVHSVVLW